MYFILYSSQNITMRDIYKTKKRNKEIFILSSLLVGLMLVLLLVCSLAYFFRDKDTSGQITLGDIDFFVISSNQSINNIVPGQVIEKKVSIINAKNSSGTDLQGLGKIFLKFSLTDNSVLVPLLNNNWIKDRNFYYYCDYIEPGETVDLFDRFVFDAIATNNFQSKNLNFNIQLYAIQAENNAYIELWPDAPNEWKERILQN